MIFTLRSELSVGGLVVKREDGWTGVTIVRSSWFISYGDRRLTVRSAHDVVQNLHRAQKRAERSGGVEEGGRLRDGWDQLATNRSGDKRDKGASITTRPGAPPIVRRFW